MLFNSVSYIFLFLPITCIIYFLLLKRKFIPLSIIWLIIVSIFFYGFYDKKYITLLLLSLILNFIFGRLFYTKFFNQNKTRKCLLFFSLFVNLLILGYYKYSNFFIENLNSIFNTNIEFAKIVLPLGISFFTFTQIAYIVDVYKREVKEYSFINYMLFVTFFPHLIAGPILHHKEMMPQFKDLKRKILNYKNILTGISLFLIGLFKKVVVADSFAAYVLNGYNLDISISMLEAWLIMLTYTFQIYFDFSAYTDMALGSAKLLNIDLPQNFNSPYKAVSIQDFWTRWHITLSRFLRDYIYIPLGGNRNGELRTFVNLLITMLLAGLWHGASWLFVIWGGVHGLALCINRLWKKTKIVIPKLLSITLTFIFLNLTWVIFRAENFEQVVRIYISLFDIKNFSLPIIHEFGLYYITNDVLVRYDKILLLLPLAFVFVFLFNNSSEIIKKVKINTRTKAILYGIILSIFFLFCITKMLTNTYTEFIYFNF